MGWDLLYGNYIKDAMESINTQSIKQNEVENCFQVEGDNNMENMGYRPKFYDCTIDGIKCIKGENLFLLHWKDSKGDGNMPIQVDQPSELILNRMKEIVNGKRDKLYLTRGMRDIDVLYLGDNKWQLYDEFDFYEFEMVV